MRADIRRAEDVTNAFSQRSLDRWYAERESREFPGVFVFPVLHAPRSACRCGEPGKQVGGVMACADHFPAVVRS